MEKQQAMEAIKLEASIHGHCTKLAMEIFVSSDLTKDELKDLLHLGFAEHVKAKEQKPDLGE